MSITVFSARKIITMNPSQPLASHIAVRDGRILAVGPLEVMAELGEYTLDEQFADKILMPGFVEGHAHALEGTMWKLPYLGFFDRKDPHGKVWPGLQTLEAVQQQLTTLASELPPGEPLIAWGFDPVYFDGLRLDRQVIDTAVADRPVVVMHSNLHVMSVNSAMLEQTAIGQYPDVEGIVTDESGLPTGELQEMAAMHAVLQALNLDINLFKGTRDDALQQYAQAAMNAGITTTTDLFNPLDDDALNELESATSRADFPVRLVPALAAMNYTPQAGPERLQAIQDQGNDKLFFGPVKMMTDGSIQGYTARLKWPGYHDGHPNGIWNAAPETLTEMVLSYHQAGQQLHIHTNGDEAVELMLDAIEEAQTLWPRADHRHTLQHAQVIDHAQLRRAAKLGICLNLFANHLYFWGDIHRERTLGYERTQRLEPFNSARQLGITTTLHCDAPVTPLSPLFGAWCAIKRQTVSGRILGETESVDVATALRMITLDAAYTLKLDDRIGSLEIGKYADMAVLDADPLEAEIDTLKDIPVLATVLGGEVHACN